MQAAKRALKRLLAGAGFRVLHSRFYRPPASCQIPPLGRIYEAVFGVSGTNVDPARSVLVGGKPKETLPIVKPDGTPVGPMGQDAGVAPARNQGATGGG